MNTILLVYLVFIVAPMCNFIHELGHMLGAKLAKADDISVNVGRGKRLFKLQFRNAEIHFGRLFFTTGYTVSKRKEDFSSIEMIYITLLGPLLNVVIVFVLYLLYSIFPSIFILIIMLYNAWLGIMNVIPFKISKQESDGYIILKELFRIMYTSR